MISYSSEQKRFLTALTACSLVLGFSKTVVMSIKLTPVLGKFGIIAVAARICSATVMHNHAPFL